MAQKKKKKRGGAKKLHVAKETHFIFMLLLFVLLLLGISGYLAHPKSLTAQSGPNVSGWAWSSNIGWVSFNCANVNACTASDYGVDMNMSTGEMSGYAWSENIGWISFNASDLAGCPSGTCSARLEGNSLAGWARARAPVQYPTASEHGGWDGWISLSGTDYGITFDPDDCTLSGFMWGSGVVGWVESHNLSVTGCVGTSSPTVSLSASPPAVPGGDSSTLSWDNTNVDECTGSGGSWSGTYTGAEALSGFEVINNITSETTYRLDCTGAVGDEFDETTVTILPPDFNLQKTESTIEMKGGQLQSSTTTLKVQSYYGFDDDVTVSFFEANPEFDPAANVQFHFEPDNVLTSSEYSTGLTFYITSDEVLQRRSHDITIHGVGGGLPPRSINVKLNVDTLGGRKILEI